ncbi:MAG: SCO family protein [Polyangiaceae bacterium]
MNPSVLSGCLAVSSLAALSLLLGGCERDRAGEGSGPPVTNVCAERPDVNLPLPAFSLIDQTGAPFTSDAMAGHVTIVDLVFTSCPSICRRSRRR